MNKALKITGIIIVALIIIAFIGILLIMHFVDPNKFKSQISKQVYNTTGRQLTIDGNLSWSFFPWVGFKVGKTELSNASGFNNTPFLTVNNVDISVAVLPLITGHVDVRNVELNGVKIHLMRNAQGRTNWDDLIQHHSTTASSLGSEPSATQPIPSSHQSNNSELNFSIANLTIVNSSLTWDDEQQKQNYVLKNLYVNGENVGTEQLFPLTVNFNLSGSKLAKPLQFNFSGSFNIDKSLQNIAINKIDAKLNQLELQGDLSLTNKDNTMTYQGDLTLPKSNLVSALASLNVDLPKFNDKDALTSVSADIAFNGSPDSLSIKPLQINLDKTAITGNASVKNLSKPDIDFKFNVNQLNVDNYMPASVDTDATRSNSDDNKASSDRPAPLSDKPLALPTDLLRNLNLNGSLNIDQFIVNNLHTSNAKLIVVSKAGLLQIKPLSADLYEGKLSANASLDVRGSRPTFYFQSTLSKVQAGPLMNDLLDKDFITGTANYKINLTSQGNSIKQVVGDLNGSTSFAFNNGTLKGINIEYNLERAKALINKKSQPAKPKTNTTPFGQFTGSFSVRNGVATTNNLLLQNPSFVGKGDGNVNLNSQKMDINFNLTTSKIPELKGYTIPLEFKGWITGPNINLDVNNVLQQVLRNTAQQEAKKALSKQVGKLSSDKNVQNALNKLLGR